MAFTATVINGPLIVRNIPDNSKMSTAISILKPGTLLTIYEVKDNWARHNYGGWSMYRLNDSEYIDMGDNIIESPPILEEPPIMDTVNDTVHKFIYGNTVITPENASSISQNPYSKAYEYTSWISWNNEFNATHVSNGKLRPEDATSITQNPYNAQTDADRYNNWAKTFRQSQEDTSKYTSIPTLDDGTATTTSAIVDETEYDELTADDLEAIANTYDTNMSNVNFNSFNGIFAAPYQYMEQADPRYGQSFGRTYSKMFLTKLPLLLITPGIPKYMKGYSDEDKTNIVSKLANSVSDEGVLESIIGADTGKYYTFEKRYDEYYKYVNPACQMLARFLRVENKVIPWSKIGETANNYQWNNFGANDAMQALTGSHNNIGFFMDAENQTSESFNNGTTTSALSSLVNGVSDQMKELQFVLGASGAQEAVNAFGGSQENIENAFSGMNDKWGSVPVFSTLLTRIKQGLATVVTGGQMAFPEIWNDSDYSRNFSISLKLRTPDADNFSWFLNIGVPLLHLICLTAPHQITGTTFSSPFIVRAYSKGLFNVDLGLISSLNIQKGDKTKWNINGLPTEVDVSLDIKDLYQTMMISDNSLENMTKNTILLDYLANMAGVNINKPDLARMINIYTDYIINKVSPVHALNNVWTSFNNTIDNTIFNKLQ